MQTRGESTDDTTTQDTQTSQEGTDSTATGETEKEQDNETGSSTEGQDEGEGGDGKGAGDDINPDTGKPFTTEEWREKFRASARGANDLLTQKKSLEGERDQAREQIAKLEKDIEDLRKIAEGKNPEGLNLRDLSARLTETSSELALLKENDQLDKFLSGTQIAGANNFKETLRSLARANPKTPIKELWDNNLAVAAKAASAQTTAARDAKKKGASDSGRGTSTREPGKATVGNTGLTLEEFNKLPVGKRRGMLLQEGQV